MRRRSIPLTPDEDALLRNLYRAFRIPTDQFKHRPLDAARFLTAWNETAGRADEWGEVLHYMVTKRKRHRWVRLDGDHETACDPRPDAILSAAEWTHLESAYSDVVLARGQGSDSLMYDRDMRAALARAFARRAGRAVPGDVLTGLLVRTRKRGELARLHPDRDGGLNFGDIDDVVA